MKIVQGKKIIEKNDFNFEKLDYSYFVLDVGTGTGSRPYRLGKENSDKYYIGLDINFKAMEKYSLKVLKKENKGGLENVSYVVSSIEDIPEDLVGKFNEVSVILPWGSLLEGIVKCEDMIIDNLKSFLKAGTKTYFTFVFTYTKEREDNTISKRELPDLSLEYVESILKSNYGKKGFIFEDVSVLSNEDLKELKSTWGKVLGDSHKREIYKVCGVVNK